MPDPFVVHNQDNTIRENNVDGYFASGQEGDFLFGGGGESESLQLSITKRRVFLFFGLIVLGLAVLLVRVAWIQIGRGDYYRSIAEGNRVRVKPLKANRGVIVDSNYNILVQNAPQFSLFFVVADLPKEEDEREVILSGIAEVLEKPYQELDQIVKETWEYSYEPVLVDSEIDYEKAMLLKLKSNDWGGVLLDVVPVRKYLFANIGLGHILGYTGKLSKEDYEELKDENYSVSDYVGKIGVEKTYEEILRGKIGKKQVEVDFLGKEDKIISAIPPVAGNDLVLSIDLGLQIKASETLDKYAEMFGATRGAVIIEEVNSGQILALVSKPDYDNNLFASGISSEDYERLIIDKDMPLFPRAFSGEYPPGSTFKLVLGAGALEDEIVTKDKRVFSSGGIWVGEWFFPDWKAGGHGAVNITRAIAESVNTFFYYVGGGFEDFRGLGLDRINHWGYLFGLGEVSGLDLVGEEDGFLPTKQWKIKYKKEPWYIGDTYHLSIGQGDILVTPLQIANYTSIIANGGTLYKPRVLKGIMFRDEKRQTNFEAEVVRKDFVDSDVLEIIREGMRDAVIYGSSRALSGLEVKVAGKTGTAQVGGDKEPHAWFTGFAPYEEPEIAITVLVENGGEGSRVAIPVAREILEYYFQDKK